MYYTHQALHKKGTDIVFGRQVTKTPAFFVATRNANRRKTQQQAGKVK